MSSITVELSLADLAVLNYEAMRLGGRIVHMSRYEASFEVPRPEAETFAAFCIQVGALKARCQHAIED